MPIGILTNSLSILLGGLLGAIFGKHIPERIRTTLPLIFGLSAMGLGVSSIMKVNAIPAVVLALILGTITGELLALEARITAGAQRLRKPLGKLFSSHHGQDETAFMEQLVAVFVLFCKS
jgi:uncharacterized membrane protein YqgA involved in biofilm formation